MCLHVVFWPAIDAPACAALRPTVFLFDDTQIIREEFLEDINGILNTGEVPSLFNDEELAAITESLMKPGQVGITILTATHMLDASRQAHFELSKVVT